MRSIACQRELKYNMDGEVADLSDANFFAVPATAQLAQHAFHFSTL